MAGITTCVAAHILPGIATSIYMSGMEIATSMPGQAIATSEVAG